MKPLLIKDISEPLVWKYAIGSDNFVVVVEANAPLKGLYDVLPALKITSKCNPGNLTYDLASELYRILAKSLEYANCIRKAAAYSDTFIASGRLAWVRNRKDIFSIVGIADPKEKTVFMRLSNSNEPPVPVSMWDIIPIVEITDVP